ncbi:subtilisin-like serine protease QhpE [Paracidobacterium acidisoli]|uniref:Peptidase S8/S53 domain-containing protein n=1 Tax=Paracidobacterium acidisoli TaxID=2303751 RepID=A0A372IJC0_9BACT|nr:S8 family serine peptidase [Paracidobacterium acidisoli]MBT9333243.1 S8 family serine peptidase [Paracidobacterium acidisoli]
MSGAVRIGIVDSGVHAGHPHVGRIAGGIAVEDNGFSGDFVDRLGHGTAVAALIHFLAPQAELLAVRIFDRRLATGIDRVIRAMDWCLENDVQIINLSLGTTNPEHRAPFLAAADRVRSAGAVLVSAFEMNGTRMLPGSLPGVIGVAADADCPREEFRVTEREGKRVFCASPFPREIPGVPREQNLQGVSFAVAHISAHLARCRSEDNAALYCEDRLARRQSASV